MPRRLETISPVASPGWRLVDLVRRNAWGGKSSMVRLRQAVADALRCAIDTCLEFVPGDFPQIFYDVSGEAEHFYTRAVSAGNTSFCIAYEKGMQRVPFFYNVPGTKQKARAFIGFKFTNSQGLPLIITSFAGTATIACWFQYGDFTAKALEAAHRLGVKNTHLPQKRVRFTPAEFLYEATPMTSQNEFFLQNGYHRQPREADGEE